MKEKPEIRILTSAADLQMYDEWIKTHPQGNLWQSLEWKKYQEALGREVRIYGCFDGACPERSRRAQHDTTHSAILASALVVIDKTTGGFSTWDIPRGPIGQQTDRLLAQVIHDAKKDKCMAIYCSPLDTSSLEELQASTRDSERCEQSPATRIIDLTKSEEEILAQMHQKGRYNIKVATKNGVTVEHSTDMNAMYTLLKGTGNRDGFGIHAKSHYVRFVEHLDNSFMLMALHDKKPIAGLIGVTWNGMGFYYYGASDHTQRNLMAPYLLQWEAMNYCKEQGCTQYDLLGIAPTGASADHPWSGISEFKSKFGGTVITYPPEQEIILKPMMRTMLKVKRKILG